MKRHAQKGNHSQQNTWFSIAAWAGILVILVSSIYTQFRFNVLPLAENWSPIQKLLWLSNETRYASQNTNIFEIIAALKKLPGNDAVFMAPVFRGEKGAENGTGFWWHLGVTLRHFCYPRRIFTLHETLYAGNKDIYLGKLQRDATRYSELPFLTGRNVGWVLSYVDGQLKIIPATTEIPK